MSAKMTCQEILAELRSLADPVRVKGMARFGITPDRAYGISMSDLRKIGRRAGTDHALAGRLWDDDMRETRILASLVDDPGEVTPEQMDAWAEDFDYWEICDQCCMNLFWRTPHAYGKCGEWSARGEEFVRRAGFALAAVLAWKDKEASDDRILALLPLIDRGASDPRPMVRKAVDWALRQVGKRDAVCNRSALELARRLTDDADRTRAWVGRHAAKELGSDTVRRRLGI